MSAASAGSAMLCRVLHAAVRRGRWPALDWAPILPRPAAGVCVTADFLCACRCQKWCGTARSIAVTARCGSCCLCQAVPEAKRLSLDAAWCSALSFLAPGTSPNPPAISRLAVLPLCFSRRVACLLARMLPQAFSQAVTANLPAKPKSTKPSFCVLGCTGSIAADTGLLQGWRIAADNGLLCCGQCAACCLL